MKTLTVPESVYEEVQQFANQVCVKQEIHTLFQQYHIDAITKKTLIKQMLADVSKYSDTSQLIVKSMILSLLFLKYEFTKQQAFTLLEDVQSTL
jgi:hypothetical protein